MISMGVVAWSRARVRNSNKKNPEVNLHCKPISALSFQLSRNVVRIITPVGRRCIAPTTGTGNCGRCSWCCSLFPFVGSWLRSCVVLCLNVRASLLLHQVIERKREIKWKGRRNLIVVFRWFATEVRNVLAGKWPSCDDKIPFQASWIA